MPTNPEMARTRRELKSPEGKTMVERVRTRLEAEKSDLRKSFDTIFKTKKQESKIIEPIELRKDLGFNPDNFELSKEVYAQMALEELDKIASGDELARIKLQDRLEWIKSIRDYDTAWWQMLLLSPEGLARIAVEDADKTRKVHAEQEERETAGALERTRGRIERKRPTISIEEAELMHEFTRASKRGVAGKGVVTSSGRGGAVPKVFRKAVAKAEGIERTGKGFATATGEFESRAEAFTAGMSLENLQEQQFLDDLDKGLNARERAMIQGLKQDYLRKLESSRKRFEDHLALARKEGTKQDVERLQGLAAKEKKLLRDLLKAQIPAVLEQGGEARA